MSEDNSVELAANTTQNIDDSDGLHVENASASSSSAPVILVNDVPSPIKSENDHNEEQDQVAEENDVVAAADNEDIQVQNDSAVTEPLDSLNVDDLEQSAIEEQEAEEDLILVKQLQEAIEDKDAPRVISIQQAVRDHDEEQWLRLFDMLDTQHQSFVTQKQNEHELDMQRLQSQIQRELSQERIQLDQQLANHKKGIQSTTNQNHSHGANNKENKRPTNRVVDLDNPIHLALNMPGRSANQSFSNGPSANHHDARVLPTGLTTDEIQLLEDVRRRLSQQNLSSSSAGREDEDPLVRSSYERLSGVGQQIKNYHRESYESYHKSMLVGLSPTEKQQQQHQYHTDSSSSTNLSQYMHQTPQHQSRQKLSQLNSYHLNRLDPSTSVLHSPESPYHTSSSYEQSSRGGGGSRKSQAALDDLKRFYESEIAELRRKLKEATSKPVEDTSIAQQRVRMVEERLRQANNEILHLHEENAQLRTKCENFPAQIAELTEENSLFRQRLDEARAHNNERETLIYDMSEKLRHFEESTNLASGLGKKDHQMIVQLMHDYDQTCLELDKKSSELVAYERKLYDAKSEIADLKSKLLNVKGEASHYESEIGYLKNRERGWSGADHVVAAAATNGSDYYGERSATADSIASLRKSLADLERRHLIEHEDDNPDDVAVRSSPAKQQSSRTRSPAKQRRRSPSPSKRANSEQSRVREIKAMERRYDDLQLEKRRLETALSHIPSSTGVRSRQHRQEREQLEKKLDKIDHEIGSLRSTLKQFQVIKPLH